MGMYTAFRCKALIKPEYHALAQTMLDANGHWLSLGLSLDKLAETYPFLQELADCERGGLILSWMVDREWKHEWYQDDEEWQPSFKDGLLTIQSCIKNYGSEYQKFAKVLDIIADRIDCCARWYEEDYGPEKYVGGVWLEPPSEPGPQDS